MSLRLILEVLDHAPESLTPKEHLAAIVLAENANERTRQIWDSVEDPKIMARIRVKRARLYELLEGLIDKGVLEQTAVGQKQSRARYRFRVLCPAQCPEHPDTEAKISVRESRNLNNVQCPEDPDVSVHGFRTPTPSLLVKEPPPPPGSAAAALDDRAAAGDGYTQDQPNPDAEAVIDKLDLQRPPGRSERALLLAPITAALTAGWTIPDLVATLGRDWTGAKDRVRTAIARAKDLGPPRRSDTTGRAGFKMPPHCGRCHPTTRMIEDAERPYRCPTCHPNASGALGQRPSATARAFAEADRAGEEAKRIIAATRGHQPYRNPTDHSVYFGGIA